MTRPETGTSFKCRHTFSQSEFDRFAALSGDDNPIHVDPGFSARTKFGRTVAHGMLLYARISSCVSKHFAGGYQISQELLFPNPTFAGDAHSISLTVAAVDPSRGTTTVESFITRLDGTPTCQGLTHIADLPYKTFTEGVTAPDSPPGEPTLKGLALGQRAVVQRTFTASDLDAYCDLTSETGPLYTDSAFARENGFQENPLPGALLGGLFSCLLGTQLPGRGTNWLKQKLVFTQPLYPGQEVVAAVEIVRLRPEKDLVNLKTTAEDSRGAPLCRGEALVLVKDLEQ